MRYLSILYFTFAFFLVACSPKGTDFCRLAEADTLLYHSLVDSADAMLMEINPQRTEDSAYYFLLRAQTDFRLHETPCIDQINYSIRYYEHHTDCRKLAESYYYKVCYFTTLDSLPDEVFVLLKKAEHLSKSTSDINLKDKICSALAYANNLAGEFQESLKYAKLNYYYSRKLGCKKDIADAMIRLSVSFSDVGMKDSAAYYILQCEKLADYVDDNGKSFIFNLLGDYYFEDNPAIAEDYYNKALNNKKLQESYRSLADIYYAKNDTVRWRQYSDSALSGAWYGLQVDILEDMAQKYFDLGNINRFKIISEETVATLKNYYKFQKENYALEIQKKFDFERQKTVYERKMHIFWVIIACLIFLVAVVVLIYRHLVHLERIEKLESEQKNAEAYAAMEKQRCDISEYNAQIDYLQKQNGELSSRCVSAEQIIEGNNAAIAKLRHECNNLITQTDSVLSEGKIVYDLISSSQSVSDYKEKFAACYYYFEKSFPEKLVIFTPYHDLTIENRIFIIADEVLKKTDGELSKIFGISQSTVRSRRSKLKERIA